MGRIALVVDDHRGFRAEARRLLEAGGYQVVGEAEDAAGALREVARLRPDVVLLDVGLPDRSGLDLVRPLRSLAPGAVIVLVSARPAADYGDRVADADVDGFLDKSSLEPATLDAALRDRTL